MKAIFLDIDGILNSEVWWHDVMSKYGIDIVDLYNQEAMMLLKQLVNLTDARIVLSSSWRISEYSRERVMDNFVPYDLSLYSITGQEEGTRGHQIMEWLQRHPEVTEYVAFDDDHDLTELGPHFIHVDGYYGLKREHFDKALAILLGGKYEENE